jgi:hypothetical protein
MYLDHAIVEAQKVHTTKRNPNASLHPRQAMFYFRNLVHFQQLNNPFKRKYFNKSLRHLIFGGVLLEPTYSAADVKGGQQS